MKDLNELLLNDIRDIYFAEKLLTKELPKMAEKATDPELKAGFEKHYEETLVHVERLEQIFEHLGEEPKAKECPGMIGITQEGKEHIEEAKDPQIRDVVLIIAAQKVEHYEIAAYGSMCELAELLELDEVLELLQETLGEEEDTDKKLSKVAKRVNLEAL